MSEKEPFLRRWTATITVADNPLALYGSYKGTSETVEADLSQGDLQREQAKAAYAEACQYLLAGLGVAAHVQLYKTTKSHGKRRDHVEYTIDLNDAQAWAMKKILATK